MDILEILYGKKKPYTGFLEGLEECVPQFRSKSIIYYSGQKLKGGGKRRGRRSFDRAKLMRKYPYRFMNL